MRIETIQMKMINIKINSVNAMKAFYKLTFGIFLIIIVSCGDDEPDYKFKNRDASGKIENEAWAYADGYSDLIDDYLGSGETYIDITLVLAQSGTGCGITTFDGDRVFFAIPAEVGLYKLHLSLNNIFDGQTVTLFDDETGMNNISSEGAVEIISISEDEVIGRMDARFDKQNFINGNFTIPICTD